MKKSRLIFKSEASFRSINESQTNNSISKQTHSFGKSPRFSQFKPQCPLVSYFGDEIKSRRSGAGIGIGKKSDFTKDLTCSPPASKYELKTNFDLNKVQKKGCSMSSSRDQILFGSYIDRQKVKTPTANKYNIEKSMKKFKSPLYSMGSRTKILDKHMTIDVLNDNPGPGDYRNPEINNKSTRILGGSLKIDFSASKSKRFPNADNRIPGPATYEDISKLSNVGKYIVSKYNGRNVGKFLTGKRTTQFDVAAKNSQKTPGAGSYLLPSQFGYFDAADRLRTIMVPSRSRVKTLN